MVTSIINLAIGGIAFAYALVAKGYLISIIVIMCVLVVEVIESGLIHAGWLVLGEVVLAFLVVKETKRRKDESPLLKYNPMYNGNSLPLGVRLALCMVMIIAVIVRIVAFCYDSHHVLDGGGNNQQREAVNFIKDIVKAHKSGEDYRHVADRNPFPDNPLVCRYAQLLVSEYNRFDEIKNNIAKAKMCSSNIRNVELERLSEQCHSESTNVIRRIENASIGEINAERIKKDFVREYMWLQSKCR